MSRRTLVLATHLLIVVLSTVGAGADEGNARIPVHHLELVNRDGEVTGEFLRVLDNVASPPATVGLLESGEGYRAQLRRVFDREKGIVTIKFLDLNSGWWIEFRHDLGLRNLGGPEEFYDGTQWLVAVKERHARERPTSIYALATSDGAFAEWERAWDTPDEQFATDRTSALTTFAAELAREELPASAVTEIELLAALMASPEAAKISAFKPLIEETIRAVSAARGSEIRADEEVQVKLARAREHSDRVSRLMRMLPDESERPESRRPPQGSKP